MQIRIAKRLVAGSSVALAVVLALAAPAAADEAVIVTTGQAPAPAEAVAPAPAEAVAEPASPADSAQVPEVAEQEHVAPPAAPFAPAAPFVPAAAPGAPKAEQPVAKDADRGPLGDFRLGAFVGVGAPAVVSGELLLKYKKVIGLALDYGVLPTLTLPLGNSASVGASTASGTARVYPFKGIFFLGFGLGSQSLTATSQVTEQNVRGGVSVSSRTLFVMPELGFMYRFSFGLALGMDAGLEIPTSRSSHVEATAGGSAQKAPQGVTDAVATVGHTPIPVLHLLRLGYVL